MSQKPQLQIAYTELVNEFLLIKWSNETESIISSKILRDNCPCASCAGETDVFGNIYKGPPQAMKKESYIITGIQPVGYYAIRPFWKDGHHDGIYSFEFLKKLCSTFDS